MRKFILIGASFFLVGIIAAIFVFLNRDQYAESYIISDVSCVNTTTNDCSLLSFTFKASEITRKKIPEYDVKEIIEQGQSQITIDRIDSLNAQFTYDQIAESPSVERVDYKQIDNTLVLTIDRKGSLEPLEITKAGAILNIRIPENNDTYPKFSNLYPERDSITNPAFQTISVDVTMNAEYEDGFMIVDGQQERFDVATKGVNQYSFTLKKNLEQDKVYYIKVIALDKQKKASAVIWEFEAMMPIKNVLLPLDRFKYLGWWGQINKNEVNVREEPNSQSTQLHVFSTINRVKILEEVRGESIGNNDVWYKIDGGKHPGAFIFSGYVTPLKQPAPPTTFDIPRIVKPGEYWIDVNLTKKILTLFEYDKPIFATYVATGKPTSPTITGTYRIWYKLLKTRMQGGPPAADHYYDLPNVPWVMFYYRGFSIHGTYWHDRFGTQQSAGCTNTTNGDAEFIFSKTLPSLPDNKNSIFSSDTSPGTVIYNHY
jgi:hypothetical protein